MLSHVRSHPVWIQAAVVTKHFGLIYSLEATFLGTRFEKHHNSFMIGAELIPSKDLFIRSICIRVDQGHTVLECSHLLPVVGDFIIWLLKDGGNLLSLFDHREGWLFALGFLLILKETLLLILHVDLDHGITDNFLLF